MQEIDIGQKVVLFFMLAHVFWIGLPGAIYAAFHARRLIGSETISKTTLAQRALLIACAASPVIALVNECWWRSKNRPLQGLHGAATDSSHGL